MLGGLTNTSGILPMVAQKQHGPHADGPALSEVSWANRNIYVDAIFIRLYRYHKLRVCACESLDVQQGEGMARVGMVGFEASKPGCLAPAYATYTN